MNEQEQIESEDNAFRNIEIKEELRDDSIEFERIEYLDTLNETVIKINDK